MLSLAGIYPVLSFTVSQRTREIGIRRALGGQAWPVAASTSRRPLALVCVGVVLGAGLSGVPVRRALRIEPTEALKADT